MLQFQTRRLKRMRAIGALLVCIALPAALASAAIPGLLDGERVPIPKQVALIVESGRLLASNIRLSRIDPQDLESGELLLKQAEATAVIAAVTNRRILAYGPVIGWRELALLPGEQLESIRVLDFAAFIVTDRRYLNFNAETGIWAQQLRPTP